MYDLLFFSMGIIAYLYGDGIVGISAMVSVAEGRDVGDVGA